MNKYTLKKRGKEYDWETWEDETWKDAALNYAEDRGLNDGDVVLVRDHGRIKIKTIVSIDYSCKEVIPKE